MNPQDHAIYKKLMNEARAAMLAAEGARKRGEPDAEKQLREEALKLHEEAQKYNPFAGSEN